MVFFRSEEAVKLLVGTIYGLTCRGSEQTTQVDGSVTRYPASTLATEPILEIPSDLKIARSLLSILRRPVPFIQSSATGKDSRQDGSTAQA